MDRRKAHKHFENSKYIGAYTDIRFEIISNTDLGKESIRFDTKIHYIDKGKGQPLLLVHGIGQSLYTWRSSIDFFAKNGYRVIAPDLPGFGYSGHPNIYYTVEECALIIAAFLDSLKIERVHIAAFSMGALASVCFAAAHPERVGKLVLISPGGPNENYPFALKFLTTGLGRMLFRLLIREVSVQNVLTGMFFDTTRVTDEVVRGYFAPFRSKETREALIRCMEHFDDTGALTQLKSLRHKTLVFSGHDDKIHSEQMIRTYTVAIPGVKHIRIRNCSHLVHEEKPTKFNNETLSFLKQADEPDASDRSAWDR